MKTLKLGAKTYTIVSGCDQAIELLGGRGAKYMLIRNIPNPNMWALVGKGGRDEGWFRLVKTETGYEEDKGRIAL